MKFKFDYEKSLTRCRMLSSFEAAEMRDAAGESRFLEVRITAQDAPMMREYFKEAALVIEESCARVIDGADYTEDGFIWILRLDRKRFGCGKDLYRYVEEAVISYAMMQWLAKKGSERNVMYKTVWDDMLGRCESVLYRMSAPVKRRRPPYIVPDSMTLDNSEEVTIDKGNEEDEETD